MSLENLVAAKYLDAPLSPMARLAVLALGDQNAYAGPIDMDGAIATVTHWASQPESLAVQGLQELLDHGMIWVDDFDLDDVGYPAVWLTFVPGWEKDWEDRLWRRFPVKRKPISASLRRAVMERDDHRCCRCGATERLSIDHVHPVSRGGLAVLRNLQVLCRSCNSAKSDRMAVAA